jgi:hypothetical protein
MKASDLLKLALLLGAGFVAYKLWRGGSMFSSAINDGASAITDGVWNFWHPNGADSFDNFPIVDGYVLHVSKPSGGIARVVARWDWQSRRWIPSTEELPAGWGDGSYPLALMGFAEKQAAGLPWYQPWDGGAAGALTIGHGASGSW